MSYVSLLCNILMGCLIGTFLTFIATIILKNSSLILQLGNYLYIILIFIAVRFIFPFEFPFTKTFYSEKIFPAIQYKLEIPLFYVGAFAVHISHFILLIWFTVFLGKFIKLCYNYHRFYQILQIYPNCSDEQTLSAIQKILTENHIHKNFTVKRSKLVDAPFIIGFLQPVIVLPAIIYSDKELYYILCHEILHYKHHDLYIKFFLELVSTLYWWNPIIAVLKLQISKSLEINIDYMVTQNLTAIEKLDYTECLLNTAKHLTPDHNKFALTFSDDNESVLSQRCSCLLSGIQRSSHRRFTKIIATCILALILSCSILVEPSAIRPEDAEGIFTLDDVNYLIKLDNGLYGVYADDTYMGTCENPDNFPGCPIYNQKKELLTDED